MRFKKWLKEHEFVLCIIFAVIFLSAMGFFEFTLDDRPGYLKYVLKLSAWYAEPSTQEAQKIFDENEEIILKKMSSHVGRKQREIKTNGYIICSNTLGRAKYIHFKKWFLFFPLPKLFYYQTNFQYQGYWTDSGELSGLEKINIDLIENTFDQEIFSADPNKP